MGRIMSFLVEKVEGCSASMDDISECKAVLRQLYQLGLRYNDVNRYDFLINADRVKLVDFEHTQENVVNNSLRNELRELATELIDNSGGAQASFFLLSMNEAI